MEEPAKWDFSPAISHGCHGTIIKLKAGTSLTGDITSETNSEITLRMAGGTLVKIPTEKAASREDLELSLMPPGPNGTIKKKNSPIWSAPFFL